MSRESRANAFHGRTRSYTMAASIQMQTRVIATKVDYPEGSQQEQSIAHTRHGEPGYTHRRIPRKSSSPTAIIKKEHAESTADEHFAFLCSLVDPYEEGYALRVYISHDNWTSESDTLTFNPTAPSHR